MSKQLDLKLFDVRVIEHHLRRGTITQEQYQAFLDDLPDEVDEGDETETRFSPTWAERHSDDQPEPESAEPTE